MSDTSGKYIHMPISAVSCRLCKIISNETAKIKGSETKVLRFSVVYETQISKGEAPFVHRIYITCGAFGKMAEYIAANYTKGAYVTLSGERVTRPDYSEYLVVRECMFESRKENENAKEEDEQDDTSVGRIPGLDD